MTAAGDPSPVAVGDAPRVETRVERKERTRRAILDAALDLSGETSLVGVSLRQVAKEVGIVPTGFYRHFDSIESLGLALVDESFASLRAMLRDVRQIDRQDPEKPFASIVDHSVRVLADHVERQHQHFLFIARERAAGPRAVREAIRHEIGLCERELAADLALLPGTTRWSSEDFRNISNLIVTSMVATAEALIAAGDDVEAREQICAAARTQLRMVIVGALHWRANV
ncbi:TetR family transcriptional regulator [Nocardioides sp. TRM66260-LWL]|uniref:TetR family transcriptional regulator n=1 Tax=Nocardioides sp. TRM66260-LWL TaxID=2874478 RepID=UPI001CC3D5F3|nr:TetR family transcriptional regulator [Nocardioides sp. TRM66260-LWL]MBZ5734277.1 TetR family transcriptional regulator [Nocardioides sp. TRM66260-LWL]